MKENVEVLVSFRLRTTGKVLGCPVALPPGIDPHLVPTRDVIAYLADAVSVAPDEIELLDVWSKTQRN
ncbi:MAG TPA: hypothetical protein VLB49_14995 [Gemmatimonadales bacterium]|nr:hypothetical protein [Gemmatimonadales bacterium]